MTSLFEIGLSRFRWERMACGRGESAAHLPGRSRELTGPGGARGGGAAFPTSLHDHVRGHPGIRPGGPFSYGSQPRDLTDLQSADSTTFTAAFVFVRLGL